MKPEVLDRLAPLFPPPERSFDRFLRRHGRKRRNQKIGALVLALVIAVGSVAAVLEALRSASRQQPASSPISSANVGRLQVKWVGPVGADAAPPVVTDGVVVDATADGHVVAFADHCEVDGSACSPLWTAKIDRLPVATDTADGSITWWPSTHGAPGDAAAIGLFTAEEGMVYAASKDGAVYAFDVHCRADGGACGPVWKAVVPGSPGLPVVANGLVLLPTLKGTFAFKVGCGTGGSTCSPVWHAPQPGSFRVQDGVVYGTNDKRGIAYALDVASGKALWWGGPGPGTCCSNDATPVRYGATVYANIFGRLDAFPADCHGSCRPTWTATIPDAYASGPVVAGDSVVLTVATNTSTGGVLSYPVNCTTGGRECADVHRTDVDAELTSVGPQGAGNRIYAESLRGTGFYVFDASCLGQRDSCKPVWSDVNALQPWEAVVEGSVVFETDQAGGLKAFDAACAKNPCAPLWKSKQYPINRPVIADGQVLMTSTDGTIYAYAPGPPPPSTSKGGAAIFYGAVALLGVVALGGWAVRRSTRRWRQPGSVG